MKLQVNLIKSSEIRNNAPVSPRVVMLGAAGFITLLIGLIVLKSVMAVGSEKNRLSASLHEYEKLKPKYEAARVVVSQIQSRRNILGELERWKASSIHWAEPMRELQSLVPNPVQLTKLNVQGSHRFIEESEEAEEGKEAEVSFRQVRMYKITLDGRVSGERGDQVVLNFVRKLPQGEQFKPLLESAKLQKMQRDPYAQEDDPVRLFAIEGRFFEREL